MMNPSPLRRSLDLLTVVAGMTLVRSLLFERWFTVTTASLLLLAAVAALRGRTWGIGLAFGAAASFVVAAAIGFGPPWFGVVGVLAAIPFALSYRSLARFDAGATLFGAALSSLMGAVITWVFAVSAHALFRMVPMLAPARRVEPGGILALEVLGLATLGVLLSRSRRRQPLADGASCGPSATPLPMARIARPLPSEPSADDTAVPDDETSHGVPLCSPERGRAA